MTMQQTNYDKASNKGQLDYMADQMSLIYDQAMDLEIACSWYHEDDPSYGGPPSVDKLMLIAKTLKIAYMRMAQSSGLDPCEQLPSTKERLRKAREKASHIDFDT